MLVREEGARRVDDPQPAPGSQFQAGNEAIFRFKCFFWGAALRWVGLAGGDARGQVPIRRLPVMQGAEERAPCSSCRAGFGRGLGGTGRAGKGLSHRGWK